MGVGSSQGRALPPVDQLALFSAERDSRPQFVTRPANGRDLHDTFRLGHVLAKAKPYRQYGVLQRHMGQFMQAVNRCRTGGIAALR